MLLPEPHHVPHALQEDKSEWEKRVNTLLQRLACHQSLASSYSADDIFPGQTLLFATHADASGSALLAQGGPGGAWRRIAFLVQPAAEHVLPERLGQEGAGRLGHSVHSGHSSPVATSAAHAVQAALLSAVQRKVEAEEAEGEGGLSLSMMSPRPLMPSPHQHHGGAGMDGAAPARTFSIVLPLNRLCPERRCGG